MNITIDTRRVRRLEKLVARSRRERERQRIREEAATTALEDIIALGIERANLILDRHAAMYRGCRDD